MKKNLKNISFLFSLVLFLFSCQKVPYTDNDLDQKKRNSQSLSSFNALKEKKSSIKVSLEDARAVALGYAKYKLSTKEDQIQREIINEFIYQEGDIPYLFIFNFKDKNGFVIVSAEAYEHPILAYSNKGEIHKDAQPCGLSTWIDFAKAEINDIRKGYLDTNNEGLVEWATLAKSYGIPSLSKTLPDPDPPCEEGTIEYTVGPLLQTQWGQGCNYNDYCPSTTNGSYCNHSPTGCVATSMSQVLKYWSSGSSYNWTLMPNNWGSSEIARLMSAAGVAVSMSYGFSSSGAYMTDVPNGFTNNFGYSSAQHINYNLGSFSTVQQQLSWYRPVILGGVSNGSGHAWVCDGFSEYRSTWCNPDGTWAGGQTTLFFHMNWGWDGMSNGNYSYNNWTPSGTSSNYYSNQREAIINIHP